MERVGVQIFQTDQEVHVHIFVYQSKQPNQHKIKNAKKSQQTQAHKDIQHEFEHYVDFLENR